MLDSSSTTSTRTRSPLAGTASAPFRTTEPLLPRLLASSLGLVFGPLSRRVRRHRRWGLRALTAEVPPAPRELVRVQLAASVTEPQLVQGGVDRDRRRCPRGRGDRTVRVRDPPH